MNSVPSAGGVPDGKLADKKQRASYSEIRNLFSNRSEKPLATGSVAAIVEVDENGYGTVIEIDSEDEDLLQYVAKKIEKQHFKNLKNETIRLVVDFRK